MRKLKLLTGAEAIIGLSGWSLFSYFSMRAVTAIIWLFGIRLNYHYLFVDESVERVTLAAFSIIALWATLVYFIMNRWRHYNYKRYAHLTRRKFQPEVTLEELCAIFSVSPEVVSTMRSRSWVEAAAVNPLPGPH